MRLGRKQLILFILVFTVDVKIRAATPDVDLIDFPSGCWHDQSVNPCAVWSIAGRAKLSAPGLLLELASGSVIKRSEKTYALIRGSVLVDSSEPLEVGGLWGSAHWQGGRVLLKRTESEFRVLSLNANVKVRSLTGETGSIAPGFETSVRPKGLQMKVEIPRALTWREWIRSLVEVKGADKVAVREALNEVSDSIRAAQAESSVWQRQLADRAIASERRQEELRKEVAQRSALEDRQLRQMFRSKYLADSLVED